MNNHQIKEINNNNDGRCDLNMEILSSLKAISCKTIPFGSKEIIDRKNNFFNSSYIEENNSQKNTCSTTLSNKDYLSILNLNKHNLQNQNYLSQIPIFKPLDFENQNPFYDSMNYFLNFYPSYNFYINQNSYSPFYFNNNNLSPLIINQFSQINESSDKNILLNKKRLSDEINSKNKKDLDDNFFNLSEKNLEIKENDENNDEKIKKRKKYYCKHCGCDISFKTKKLANFHHLKMSPECQEDSVYFLKLIYETKKLLLKNIEKNKKSFDKFSSLYENALKDISLNEYIKIYTGFKIKDLLY